MSEGSRVTGPSGGERLINLAHALLSAVPRSFTEILGDAEIGYPQGSTPEALEKMFSRDKAQLRQLGLPLIEEDGLYRIDPGAAFTQDIELTAPEAAWLQIVAETLVDDPGFIFGDDLVSALGKVGRASSREIPLRTTPAAEGVDQHARTAFSARVQGARLDFRYTKADGSTSDRSVLVDTVFSRGEHNYVVARDPKSGESRHFRTDRMSELVLRPPLHDADEYEPLPVDVREVTRLPFQFGEKDVEVTFRIPSESAWRVDHITAGKGIVQKQSDGSVHWIVDAHDEKASARWAAAQAAGIEPIAPESVVEAYGSGLEAVLHGKR